MKISIKFSFVCLSVLILFKSFNSYSHDCKPFSLVKKIFQTSLKEPISGIDSSIDIEEAYCTQDKLNYLINQKHNDKIGYKVGFTSNAAQEMVPDSNAWILQ